MTYSIAAKSSQHLALYELRDSIPHEIDSAAIIELLSAEACSEFKFMACPRFA